MTRQLGGLMNFDVRAKGLKRSWLASTLFWNPVINFTIVLLISGTHHLFTNWFNSFQISTIVSQVCFGGVYLARRLDVNLARRKGRAAPQRSRSWWFSLSVLIMPFGLFTAFKIIAFVDRRTGKPDYLPDLNSYKTGIIFGTVIAGIFFLLNTRGDAREQARLAQERLKAIENERLHAQISALTAQMNPHLLFNALNTVASLVPTDPVKAEEMIVRLAELYRGVLDSSRNMTHSLATEIKICEAYLAVEKARFGHRLDAAFEIQAGIDADSTQVPTLSIQPLIENAIKHGFSHRASGGQVRIIISPTEGERVSIAIEDDGAGLPGEDRRSLNAETGARSGLKNCRDRLALHYGERSSFEIRNRLEGGTVATLIFPKQPHSPGIIAARES